MKPDDPQPYDAADKVYVQAMDYVGQDNNQDRSYTYASRNDTKTVFATIEKQQFFYRAMKRVEAVGWLTAGYPAVPDAGGHHPWASYRNYSLDYLTRGYGYTHLVEVYAPGFITWMKEVGWIAGKGEDNDISWGIGGTSSNGFAGTPTTNAALKALYAKVANNGVPISHNHVPGGLRAMAKRVAPYIFKQSIKWTKLVNLRSQKP